MIWFHKFGYCHLKGHGHHISLSLQQLLCASIVICLCVNCVVSLRGCWPKFMVLVLDFLSHIQVKGYILHCTIMIFFLKPSSSQRNKDEIKKPRTTQKKKKL